MGSFYGKIGTGITACFIISNVEEKKESCLWDLGPISKSNGDAEMGGQGERETRGPSKPIGRRGEMETDE
jgi:hypothetical protein